MFGRKTPRSRAQAARAWIYPAGGQRRAARYLIRRIIRLNGTPHALAGGFAFGAAVSFLPVPGLHFILGAIMSVCIRGSIIASAIGTAIGNPWTFPFIWIGSYRLGRWLGFGGEKAVAEGSLGDRLGVVVSDIWKGRFRDAAVESWPVLEPMLVGGGIMAVVVWIAFYILLKRAIAAYQERRRERMEASRQRRASLRTRALEEGQA